MIVGRVAEAEPGLCDKLQFRYFVLIYIESFLFRTTIELDNIASSSVRGLPPTDALWCTTIGRPNSRSPRLCPPEAGKAEANRSIRERRPLGRQNKVGGGRAPDQPERSDRRTQQKAHQSIFCKLLLVAQPRKSWRLLAGCSPIFSNLAS